MNRRLLTFARRIKSIALLARRVDMLEQHVSRETDRARKREGAKLLADRTAQREEAATFDGLTTTIERRNRALADRLLVLQRELDSRRTISNELGRQITETRNAFAKTTDDVQRVLVSIVARLDGLTEGVQNLDAGRVGTAEHLQGLQSSLTDLQSAVINLQPAVSHLQSVAGDLQPAVSTVLERVHEVEGNLQELINRHRAIPYMAKPIFPLPAPPLESNDQFDYVGFEDVFRGSEELVRDRQRAYLRFMREGQRIIDLGCGRGEFLDIARNAGALAVGVDMNRAMVERCAKRGFDVREADALGFLQNEPDRSADLVFSAQFIEHLTPDNIHSLFAAARRVLTAGGMMIAETVNPHSIEALKCFYVDLTHVKPLFPEVMLFFARAAGFTDAQIFYPTGDGFTEQKPWDRGEYALVATV